ncbi:MAG: septal ring lytic transglycosylase RlpA family protein [Proteobacteria bacterium]|nr:septal ring lytic transglycosylase RlpA family protein [Pseudomonadota bacterium]
MNRVSFAVALCVGVTTLTGVADARHAPIEYAADRSSVTPASSGNDLAGGDARSYGYGVSSAQGDGVVVDLRPGAPPQTGQPNSASPASPPSPTQVSATGQSRPAWLENERVGPPYQANGRWYVPAAEPGYEATGTASWYGPTFHGGRTASGEIYDQEAITAAHPTLPIPSLVQVTNLENGREVIVRVNDRGPFVGDRILDLSHGAAQVLGVERNGTARVHIRYLGPAPRHYGDAAAPIQASAPPPPPPAQAPIGEQDPTSLLPPRAQVVATAPATAEDVQPVTFQPTTPTPLATSSGSYFVQVGAFSDVDNAHRAQAAVSGAGQASVDVRRTRAGTELFRVRVGPYASREAADAARRTVIAQGYAESVVVAP